MGGDLGCGRGRGEKHPEGWGPLSTGVEVGGREPGEDRGGAGQHQVLSPWRIILNLSPDKGSTRRSLCLS